MGIFNHSHEDHHKGKNNDKLTLDVSIDGNNQSSLQSIHREISAIWKHHDTNWIDIPGYEISITPNKGSCLNISHTLFVSSNHSHGNFYYRYKITFQDENNVNVDKIVGVNTMRSLQILNQNITVAASGLQCCESSEAVNCVHDNKKYITSVSKPHRITLQTKITDGSEMILNRLYRPNNSGWNGYMCSVMSVNELSTHDKKVISEGIIELSSKTH